MDETKNTQGESVLSGRLPAYKCHKIVRAFKIDEILPSDVAPEQMYLVSNTLGGRVVVGSEYIKKHEPTVGGYYVLYEAGYESFSPAGVFESGYSLISE